MEFLLYAISLWVVSCLARHSASAQSLQEIQQEMEQLKRSNEESIAVIAALKQTYDEKIRTQDEKIRAYDEKVKGYDMKIASLEQQLRTGKTHVPPTVEAPVAFSTRLNEDTNINDGAVIFGTVDLNIGNGYDEFTGVFRPPVDGVYVLTFYGLVVGTNGGTIYIKRNDDVLCRGYLQTGQHFDTSTCTAVAELTEGDSVRVTGTSGDPADLAGGSYSGFAGFLIYDS